MADWERGRREEKGDVQLLFPPLYAIMYLPVWCHDSLHLLLNLQAPICEMGDFKYMITRSSIIWRPSEHW
jgi:hypothetical protein